MARPRGRGSYLRVFSGSRVRELPHLHLLFFFAGIGKAYVSKVLTNGDRFTANKSLTIQTRDVFFVTAISRNTFVIPKGAKDQKTRRSERVRTPSNKSSLVSKSNKS